MKLLHGADFHLDSPFSALDPQRAAQRRGEQRNLLTRLAALAQSEHCDLVLLSGDIFDGGQVFRETVQALADALGAIPCPVFIAPGNHDFYSTRSPYATLNWPENVHIFTENQVESIHIPQLNCTVYGAAFTSPRMEKSPLDGFSVPQDGTIHVMTLHGEVGTQGDYAPISPDAISRSGLTYLALGHVHQASGLQRTGDTHWAYPGCPEGRGFDELGEKGVSLVTIEGDSVTAQFCPLCARQYQIFTVDLTGGKSPLTAISAALPPDTQNHVYRILLTGQREMADVGLSALCDALSPRFYGLDLRDHTRPPQSLWARLEEDNLTGLFLQEMAALTAANPQDDSLLLATQFGLAALEHGEDVAP